MSRDRRAREADIGALAEAMPDVEHVGSPERPAWAVRGKQFVTYRGPRADAVDPDTGERYEDVVVFWTATPEDKEALVQDDSAPFFTTAHFNGYRAVLLRTSQIHDVKLSVLREVVQDAWLARAPRTLVRAWQERGE